MINFPTSRFDRECHVSLAASKANSFNCSTSRLSPPSLRNSSFASGPSTEVQESHPTQPVEMPRKHAPCANSKIPKKARAQKIEEFRRWAVWNLHENSKCPESTKSAAIRERRSTETSTKTFCHSSEDRDVIGFSTLGESEAFRAHLYFTIRT